MTSKRRGNERKAKTRAKVRLTKWGLGSDDPARVGKWASTHGKPCSCYMCGNPRRHFGEKTRQELIADINFEEMKGEI
jgi:hypothetical protein